MSRKLQPLDVNFWTIDTKTTQQTIAAFCPLDRIPDLGKIRTNVGNVLPLFPRLSWKVDEQEALRWIENPDINLDSQVTHISDPSILNHETLFQVASRRFAQGLAKDGALWRLEVISGTAPDSPAAVLFLLHHAFTDGLGGLELFDTLCSSKEDSLPEVLKRRKPGENMNSERQLSRTQDSRFRGTMKLISEAFNRIAQGPLNGANSAEREILAWDLPLKPLLEAKRSHSSSLNDVMLALVTGGVRRYQLSMGEKPKDAQVIMPVSLRKLAERWDLGNYLSGVAVRLPISSADPREQIRKINASVQSIKVDGSFSAYELLGKITSALPQRVRLALCEAAARRTNFICTNIIAAKRTRYIGGARILGNYGLAALMRGHGVAFAFSRYAENMCLSLVSDPQIVSEPQRLKANIQEAYHDLIAGL